MARDPYPSETQDRFLVRFPDGMRDRIAEAAKANGRSMNAEIVQTLEEKYPSPPNYEQALMDLHSAAKILREDATEGIQEQNIIELRRSLDEILAVLEKKFPGRRNRTQYP